MGVSRVKIFNKLIEFDHRRRERTLEMVERIAAEDAAAIKTGSGEWVADELAELDADMREFAELQIVGVYHWTERQLKALLSGLPGSDKDKVAHYAWKGIKQHWLKDIGSEVTDLACGKEINLLRLFTNSYKHNPGPTPDEELRSELGIDEVNYKLGLLDYPDLAPKLAARLGLYYKDSYFPLCRATLVRALRFLHDAAAAIEPKL